MVTITWAMNLSSVIIAAIVSMILGMVWYGPIFGNLWMKLSGKTAKDAEAQKKKGMTVQMIASFLGNVIMAFALGVLFQALGVTSIGGAWAFGVVAWIGFILTATMGPVLWEGKRFGLYALNGLYSLVNILLMSTILVSW